MKVFITGVAGFLGSHIADACLARGDTVWGCDSLLCGDISNVPLGVKRFTSIACQDVPPPTWKTTLAEELLEFKPDTVIHCAATAHEGLSVFSPSFVTRNIFEASVATFSAAIAAGVKRIVFMSSMSRYGKGEPPFVEDAVCHPEDPYAASKLAAEQVLKLLCETHGVKWTICVPHSIIGLRQKYDDPARNVASIMMNRCLLGKPPIIYGDGLQERCFSPVSDCIPSIMKMVDGVADGQIVNIGPDTGTITILELANKIIKLTGYQGEPIHMPDRPCEVKLAYTSSKKARELLGYKEVQSLDDCLAEMAADIKKRGAKEFHYFFKIEIPSEKCPKTWSKRLM